MLSTKVRNFFTVGKIHERFVIVIGRTHIYWYWMNWRNRKCSSNGNRSQTPYFLLRMNEYCTSCLALYKLHLLNFSLNRMEHHFSNIEWTRTCSSFDNLNQTHYFWLWKNKHRTFFDPSLHHYENQEKWSFLWNLMHSK